MYQKSGEPVSPLNGQYKLINTETVCNDDALGWIHSL